MSSGIEPQFGATMQRGTAAASTATDPLTQPLLAGGGIVPDAHDSRADDPRFDLYDRLVALADEWVDSMPPGPDARALRPTRRAAFSAVAELAAAEVFSE